MRKVNVKQATLKFPSGYFSHIGKFTPGVLTQSKLPLPVNVVDPETKIEYNAQLIAVVPFTDIIPEVFSYLSEGKKPADCKEEILKRSNVTHIHQLAYYLYEFIN